ncbi:terminase [Burkholderia ubonensis]|uniref:terminase small subunit n=1 Tax=Burkholderia ubonensis TaxID=101571 RepID=UPI000751F10E|nr:terminase small subunit [Burkholderia ubonensis]KVM70132.1 terminase [Burkholderia ubonensis]
MSKQSKKPNAKHMRFVDEYLIDLNATQAAIRAGYSKRTAGQMGFELLKKPEIAEAIADAMKAREARTEITQDRVLQELARIAFFDPRKLFDANGKPLPINELDADTAAAIAGLEVVEQMTFNADENGDLESVPTLTKKYKILDKNTALGNAMKHLGMLRERVDLGLPPGGALVRVEFVETAKTAQGEGNE